MSFACCEKLNDVDVLSLMQGLSKVVKLHDLDMDFTKCYGLIDLSSTTLTGFEALEILSMNFERCTSLKHPLRLNVSTLPLTEPPLRRALGPPGPLGPRAELQRGLGGGVVMYVQMCELVYIHIYMYKQIYMYISIL